MHKLIATLAGSPPTDEPLSETTEVEIGQELVFLVGPRARKTEVKSPTYARTVFHRLSVSR